MSRFLSQAEHCHLLLTHNNTTLAHTKGICIWELTFRCVPATIIRMSGDCPFRVPRLRLRIWLAFTLG